MWLQRVRNRVRVQVTKIAEADAWKAGEVARGQKLEKLLFIKGIKLPEEQVKVMTNDEQLWKDIK